MLSACIRDAFKGLRRSAAIIATPPVAAILINSPPRGPRAEGIIAAIRRCVVRSGRRDRPVRLSVSQPAARIVVSIDADISRAANKERGFGFDLGGNFEFR